MCAQAFTSESATEREAYTAAREAKAEAHRERRRREAEAELPVGFGAGYGGVWRQKREAIGPRLVVARGGCSHVGERGRH